MPRGKTFAITSKQQFRPSTYKKLSVNLLCDKKVYPLSTVSSRLSGRSKHNSRRNCQRRYLPSFLTPKGDRVSSCHAHRGNTMTLPLNIRQYQSRKSGILNMAILYSDQY